ncbi:MAG TPA: O-antigen ligase family protein [Coleofasciculaceae cyanobacterium]
MFEKKLRLPIISSQSVWKYTQFGLLIFPLIPALGGVGLALAILITLKQDYRQIIQRPLNWGLAVWSVWLAIASCFAYKPTEAFLGLANFLPFLLLFAAFSVLIQTPKQLRQLAWILVIPSLPIVILGLGQQFLGWASPKQLLNIVGWMLEPNGNPPGRMASVFMYANILAAYLQLVFIVSLGLWIESFYRWRQHWTKIRGWIFLLLSVTVIGNAIALIFTSSRNAWAIAFLAALAFTIYLGWRWIVLAVATAASAILWASFGPELGRQSLRRIVPAFFWARLSDQMYPNRPVATLRATQWQFAWNMTQERPWLGWGLRNFTPLYEAKMQLWLGHPHNLLLMLTAETGIPATLFFCGLIGWVLAQGVLLLKNWSEVQPVEVEPNWNQDRLIFFTYLVAFGGFTLFNLADVTLFDLRVNTLGWLLLSAICGVVHRYQFKS